MQQEELIGTTLGHYRLQRIAGVGGMATVFVGEDLHLGRRIAVKVFQQDFQQPEESRAFLREARVLAQLDHPHILRVYDYGEEGGLAYLVMPFMMQGSLQDLLRQQRVLPVQIAISLLIQVLQGLAYAHERGLVHRDIKPGNMLFKADRSLLLSDFGIAKVVAQPVGLQQLMLTSATATNRIIGTPAYMAPEQAKRQATPLSDIYSMGVVLYEMVTGSRPFQAEHPMALFMKHLTEAPRPPRQLNPGIPLELEQVILRALTKEPAQRFPDAQAFIQALEQILVQEQEQPAAPTQIDSHSSTGTGIPTVPALDGLELASTVLSPVRTGTPISPTQAEMAAPPGTLPSFPRAESVSGVHPPRPVETRHPPVARRLILSLLALILLTTPGIYLLATGRLTPAPARTQSSLPGEKPTEAPTITPTLADCPASGQARKASLPDLATGSAPALVYLAMIDPPPPNATPTAPSASKLEIWNTRTKKTILVATFLKAQISQALVSPDGKWLLFSLGVQQRQKLELMRIDGQDLQTLYCSTNDALIDLSWSPDRRLAVFYDEGAQRQQGTFFLLNMSIGLLETISTVPSFLPISWMDKTHLLVEYFYGTYNPPLLLLVDMDQHQPGETGNIPGLSPSSFQFAFQQIPLDVSTLQDPLQSLCPPQFARGEEANQLFVLTCASNGTGVNGGPSAIYLETYPQWSAPGTLRPIYTSSTHFFAAFWVISSTTLLVAVRNIDRFRTTFPDNGLWKITINAQGGGPAPAQQLTRGLFPDGWPASRDGTLYAVSKQGRDLASNTPTSQLLVGSLTGGAPTPVVSASGDVIFATVGWTTI
jgi:serine/threonine protein kinase